MKTKFLIESIFIAAILLTASFLTVVGYQSVQSNDKKSNTNSSSDDWYYLPAFPDYAPNGLPDFNQTQQDDWRDWGGKVNLCGAVSLADILWWFDSKREHQSGYAGDGNDSCSLVQDYHALGSPVPGPNSDDHNYNNVNDNQTPYLRFKRTGELIERIAWYTNRQKDMKILCKTLGSLTPFFYAFTLLCGIKKWLFDCHLQKNFSVKPIFKPSFSTIITYLQNNAGIILGLSSVGNTLNNSSSSSYWGHFVAVAGINPLGYIAFSDPIQDKMNPSSDPYEHNNASIVSHDIWQVNFTSPDPTRSSSWWLPDYFGGALIIGALIISEKS